MPYTKINYRFREWLRETVSEREEEGETESQK